MFRQLLPPTLNLDLGQVVKCPTMWQMKRVLLRLLLVVLVLAELWLLTGFLPQRWQERLYTPLYRVWPSQSYDYSRVTHPNLDYELQPFKPAGLGLLAVLAATNGMAIAALWIRRNR